MSLRKKAVPVQGAAFFVISYLSGICSPSSCSATITGEIIPLIISPDSGSTLVIHSICTEKEAGPIRELQQDDL
jgi:hypothetical protein